MPSFIDMGLSKRLPKEKWRRLGILNVSLITSCGLILLAGLISVTSSRPGSTILEARILFRGECRTSNNLNLFLQLVINIFSTCVLASSNFFMQIVSSPTRNEIDRAHRSLHSLEIGVSSLKNLGSLSWFKILAWAALFLTSVPIHLLFNSVIYPIDYQGSDWHLTIAAPGFVNQSVDYFIPGASLAAAGSSCPASPDEPDFKSACSYPNISINAGTLDDTLTTAGSSGYGQDDPLARTNVARAAQNSSSWEILTPSDCFDQYRFCKPRQKYRDLVVVVDEVSGWTRSEVYNFSGNEADALSRFWDPQIPPNRLNSLWYSTPCRLWRNGNGQDRSLPGICDSSIPPTADMNGLSHGCSGALGEPSGVDWIGGAKLQGSWRFPFRPENMTVPSSFGYDEKFNEMVVKHCRAEPNPEYVCKLGLAPPLLLVVIGCVFIKGMICTGILFSLTHTSLVTPGDAISSFISKPDPNTAGLATMELADAQRLEYLSTEVLPVSCLFNGPRARRWKPHFPRFKSLLSVALWVRTYATLVGGIALLGTVLGMTVADYGSSAL